MSVAKKLTPDQKEFTLTVYSALQGLKGQASYLAYWSLRVF
jgi:hypothetical protein